MSDKSEIATTKFLDGYNCAQAVFYAYCEDLQFDKHTALKLACGFGAGMGRKQEVCGAVSGGVLVIGAKYGRGENSDPADTETTYKKTAQFIDLFAKKHGTVNCRKLLNGCDFSIETGRNQFKDMELKKNTCLPCVRSVIEILDSIS